MNELPTIEFDHQAWKAALPKDISRRKLAKLLKTTDANLISIEKGNTKPSILLAFKYCLYTGLPVSDLCRKN